MLLSSLSLSLSLSLSILGGSGSMVVLWIVILGWWVAIWVDLGFSGSG